MREAAAMRGIAMARRASATAAPPSASPTISVKTICPPHTLMATIRLITSDPTSSSVPASASASRPPVVSNKGSM